MANFKVCSIFDTETTTLGEGLNSVSFACLYIVNDLRDIDLTEYKADVTDDIKFYRNSKEFITYLQDLIYWGREHGIIPIVAAYNLSFDLQTIVYTLSGMFSMKVLAQSPTNFYTLDLYDEAGEHVLRFWETFYLEMGGLAAMGRTCGLDKAVGDWDYSLIRSQDTPLTDAELFYASRDVQVIPAYLNWLLRANEHIKLTDLGVRVMTKTSLVRQLGARVIGKLKNDEGKTTYNYFTSLCKSEKEKSYEQYALRKACFRGGLTFTAGKCAGLLYDKVASFDVVSMHHTFINGRTVPVKFKKVSNSALYDAMENVRNTPLDRILSRYDKPFLIAFNIAFTASNVRLKEGSVFERQGIATLPYSKFGKFTEELNPFDFGDIRNLILEDAYRKKFSDKADNPIFAFGKLVSADKVELNLTELEWWVFNQVYDYDSYEPLMGEVSTNFKKPPTYVTLQSNLLFEQKSAVKKVLSKYKEGEPYPNYSDLELLPDNLQNELKTGKSDFGFLNSYYTSTVKGMFNSVYGTMAQDVYKPDFIVEDGEVEVDKSTMPSDVNFNERGPKTSKVLYTYGARIVGGSRMHLVLAMMLIDSVLGERVQILGGDTDSLKIQLNKCTVDDILKALEPLHIACDNAIDSAQSYVRKNFSSYASGFDEVGHFEYEGTTYTAHVELWNKARVSYDGEHCHVTLAGVPRPYGKINIETYCDRYVERHGKDKLHKAIGYNTKLEPSISYFLGIVRPGVSEIFDDDVTDYLGNTFRVRDFKAVSLYPASKEIGSTLARVNADNVKYLKDNNIIVDTLDRQISLDNEKIYVSSLEGMEVY